MVYPSGSYEDKELEEILRKKYEAYQQKLQESRAQVEQQQQKELEKQKLLLALFTADAREVLRNLELRGDKKLVEEIIQWAYKMYLAGRLREKINKQRLQLLLKYLHQGKKKDWKITFKRK